jgi:uncharacterized phiE125 gp8 family phage protein
MGLQPLTDSTNPLTLSDVKMHLRVVDDLVDANTEQPYSSDDATLAIYLQAAFEWVENETRQQLCNREYLLMLDGFPRRARGECDSESFRQISLPKPPLVCVDSVHYLDPQGNLQTLSPSTYIVDATTKPGRVVLAPGQSWPQTNNATNCVRVCFTAGYGWGDNIPTLLEQAILLLAGDWYENREDIVAARISNIPTGVRAICNLAMFPEAVG